MKKTLLIWGTALVLIVIAIIVTNGYGKSGPNQTLPDNQSFSSRDQDQAFDNSQENKPETEAIDFTLTDLDGNTVSLSDYKGKSVYLNFFATWCPPCRAEMPDIEKVYQKYKDKDFVVLAVDLGEDKDTVKSFIEDNGYSFKVLLDSDQSVGQQYEISAIPVSVFIDKNGKIVNKRVGALSEDEMEEIIKSLVENE